MLSGSTEVGEQFQIAIPRARATCAASRSDGSMNYSYCRARRLGAGSASA